MFSYRICGSTFHSNIPIPELVSSDEQDPEFTFQFREGKHDFSESCDWLNHWDSTDGSLWLAFGKLEKGYLLRFPKFADFILSTDARSIRCYLKESCPPETMRHLLLNQVFPIALSHSGKLVLHASACTTPHGVMAFMGMTGMGKSTLAASFGLRGLTVLTDDCLVVEEQDKRSMTVTSYPGVRLWPESVEALFDQEPEMQPLAHYTDKKRVLFNQDHLNGRLALSVIYVLAEQEIRQGEDNMIITPLNASEAFFETVKHTFQLDVTDREKLGEAFKRYEWLAKSVPFFRLAFPREHALLPSVITALLNHLELIHVNQSFQMDNEPGYRIQIAPEMGKLPQQNSF